MTDGGMTVDAKASSFSAIAAIRPQSTRDLRVNQQSVTANAVVVQPLDIRTFDLDRLGEILACKRNGMVITVFRFRDVLGQQRMR